MNYTAKAQAIIENILYLTVATVTPEGEPWNSPVRGAFDNDFNFYWASWVENQHSKNIAINPNVFIVIYDSTVPEGTGWGVYMKAKARALEEPSELHDATTHFYRRIGKDIPNAEKFLNDSPRRLYQAVPESVWMNESSDKNGHYVDVRVPISLDQLKTL